MARVTSIAWLRKGDIGVVNRIGSSSPWPWGMIFKLHLGKGELEQVDGAGQVGFELFSMKIDHWSMSTKWTIRSF